MKFSQIVSVIVLVVFIVGFFVLRIVQWKPGEATIIIHNQEARVLVANTPSQLYRGLGKRDSLEGYSGMVLMFPKSGRHGIVMREMRFSLDIVWLQHGVVVDIAHQVPVEQVGEQGYTPYFPREDANAVLELPAGDAMRYGLAIGDKIEVGKK